MTLLLPTLRPSPFSTRTYLTITRHLSCLLTTISNSRTCTRPTNGLPFKELSVSPKPNPPVSSLMLSSRVTTTPTKLTPTCWSRVFTLLFTRSDSTSPSTSPPVPWLTDSKTTSPQPSLATLWFKLLELLLPTPPRSARITALPTSPMCKCSCNQPGITTVPPP